MVALIMPFVGPMMTWSVIFGSVNNARRKPNDDMKCNSW
jgi:hypothetical protein